MDTIKLQNIIVKPTDRTHNYEKLYVRSKGDIFYNSDGSVTMTDRTIYDFATYFGSLSIKKWNKYTNIDKFYIELEMSGQGIINIVGYINDNEYNTASREVIDILSFHNQEYKKIKYPLSCDKCLEYDVIAFEIETVTECIMKNSYYSAEPETINEVKLNIIMPTFKKETFVMNNVKLFEELAKSGELISNNFTVSIIDNGRTLPEVISNSMQISKYTNPNVGGAGGFARGMIEALESENQPTHILVMDDDVEILPESFIRTFSLLTLASDEYKNAFISGAMLMMQLPDIQIEDVGNMFSDGTFGGVKPQKNMSDLNCVVSNEDSTYNRQRQYAAFWYCCFPINTLDNGLTMPFFVRGDDAEFGMRTPSRKFMTLNGICVWHMAFGHSKFNAFNECYLAIRNALIISAINEQCKDITVYNDVFESALETELRKFNYDYCEMMLDAVEDYMKGPSWLIEQNPEEILKNKNSMKPVIKNLSEKLPGEAVKIYDWEDLNVISKVRMKLTHNGHKFTPEKCYNDSPGIILNEFRSYHPKKIYLKKELILINDDLHSGYHTKIDKKRYKEIIKRKKKLDKLFYKNKEQYDKAWMDAHKFLTSKEFWNEYIKKYS